LLEGAVPEYFLHPDAPEAQRHVSDRRLGRRATSGNGRTVVAPRKSG